MQSQLLLKLWCDSSDEEDGSGDDKSRRTMAVRIDIMTT
jgi:hypothetical protein